MPTLEKTPLGCRPSQFLGPWAMDAQAYDDLYDRAMAIIAAGQLETVARQSAEDAKASAEQPPYTVENGVARFTVSGPLTRYPMSMQSALGGTATLPLERAIRQATNESGFLRGAFFDINSPGGTTEGMADTSEAIANLRGKLPVRAHISGTGASAAYRLAIEGDTITADPMSAVGSVGVLTMLRDTSKLMERAGITNHYIGSGDLKSAGRPGSPVPPELIAERQSLVNEMNAAFQSAVATRRGKMTPEHRTEISRGGIYGPQSAMKMGLIDAIQTADQSFEQFTQRLPFGEGRTLPG